MATAPAPVHVPAATDFLVFGKPAIADAEIDEVVATLRSGWLSTGPKVRRFEEEFAAYIGCDHALALNSGTAGLYLALEIAVVGPGDEVITTPLTFAATANVIVHRGARPVFVDVDRRTQCIDPAMVERAITPRTRAITVVHMTGRPCEMDPLIDIAHQHNLALIEDAAHAIEAVYRGRKIGTLGDATAFSFYVTKNLCTGEGGMLVTNHQEWAEEARVKSLHGLSKNAWKRYSTEGFQPYEVLYAGYKFNMMDIQAALGLHQLARIEQNLAIREQVWRRYDEAFADLPRVCTPNPDLPPDSRHARHLYTLALDVPEPEAARVRFIEALRQEGIGTGVHFTALHLHRFYREHFGFASGDFPNAEWWGSRTVSLPLSASLTSQDVDRVIAAVRRHAPK